MAVAHVIMTTCIKIFLIVHPIQAVFFYLLEGSVD
jgi:hypothetical protein